MSEGVTEAPAGASWVDGFEDDRERPRSAFPWPTLRWIGIAFAVTAALWVVGQSFRFAARGYYTFLPDYLRWAAASTADAAGPKHVFLVYVDHFEPMYDAGKVADWSRRYRQLASRHRDADGRPPQHTWFYPAEQYDKEVLIDLQDLVADGFGEVELHYHHMFDTPASFRVELVNALETFQRFGFLKTVDGASRFAFIHGNSGLDNGNGPELCGIDEELRMLREAGCFADFTFPSLYEPSQPPSVNSIYAAKDDPRPKSYSRRLPLSYLRDGRADLMIFEGPLFFAPSWSLHRLFLDLDDGDVHGTIPASPTRADRWIRANVHVPERPDWVFVKIFSHGISTPEDEAASTGPALDETLGYLEHEYNDGRRYVLHYITAREAYNLAMAAAAGVTGDPAAYYDYLVKPYVADPPDRSPAAWHAQ